MKTINYVIVSLFMMILTCSLKGQDTKIDQYFEFYLEDERFSRVSVSSRMFDLFMELEMDDPDEQALVETISKLDGLKVLIGEQVEEAETIYEDILAGTSGEMDELMSISDPQKDIRFYITEQEGKISELVMLAHGSQQVMVMSLRGDIDIKEIARLSHKMNITGFEHFKNLKK